MLCRIGFRESERASRAHPGWIFWPWVRNNLPSSLPSAVRQDFSVSLTSVHFPDHSLQAPLAVRTVRRRHFGRDNPGWVGKQCVSILRGIGSPAIRPVALEPTMSMVIPKRFHSIPLLTINLTRTLQVCYSAIISKEFARHAGGAGISAGPAEPWRL